MTVGGMEREIQAFEIMEVNAWVHYTSSETGLRKGIWKRDWDRGDCL